MFQRLLRSKTTYSGCTLRQFGDALNISRFLSGNSDVSVGRHDRNRRNVLKCVAQLVSVSSLNIHQNVREFKSSLFLPRYWNNSRDCVWHHELFALVFEVSRDMWNGRPELTRWLRKPAHDELMHLFSQNQVMVLPVHKPFLQFGSMLDMRN